MCEIRGNLSFQASTHCSLGSRGGPEQRTRLVPSDKCAASWGSEDAEMRMITARCVRVLLRYTDVGRQHYLCSTTQRFWSAYGPIAQHFRPRRHLMSASRYREEMHNRRAGRVPAPCG